MLQVEEYLKAHDQETTIKTGVIKEAISKVTADHKRDIGSGYLSKKLFSDVIRLFLKNNSEWKRQGQALIKALDKAGQKVEEEAVA